MKKFLISASGVAMAAAMVTAASAASLTVPNTFTAGTSISSSAMNANFTAVQTAVNALDTSSGSCTKNAGDDTNGMTRVGPVCVDKYLSRLSAATLSGATPTCAVGGTTGCGSVVAVSTATGTINYQVSFAQAARACANAGKRLLTPGEWVAAFAAGALSDVTDGKAEYVSVIESPTAATDALHVGYIGTAIGGGGSTAGVPQGFANALYNDNANTFISFRCAR